MPGIDTNRAFYEAEADVYHISAEEEEAFVHRRNLIRRILPDDPGGVVLDAGCADGALCSDLLEHTGARVVGMDLARKRVDLARSRVPRASFVQGSLYELPFADGSFGTVVCTDVLEHLDEPQRAMDELVRVASRWVLVSVPYSIRIEKTLCTHCGKDYFLYGHQHNFEKRGVEELARRAGARVDRFEHVIPMFECRRYRYLPFLKWLIWDHFKNSGTLGARIRVGGT